MRSLFIGVGPSFPSSTNGTMLPVFENVELYNLICDICGVSKNDRVANDGDANYFNEKFGGPIDESLFYKVSHDDFAHLAAQFGNYSTYNIMWGGYPAYEAEPEPEPEYEDEDEDTEEQENIFTSATPTPESTPIRSTRTIQPSSTTTSTKTTSAASEPVMDLIDAGMSWWNELLDDGKELLNSVIEDLVD